MIKENRSSRLLVTEYRGALNECVTQMKANNLGSALFYFNLHMSTHERSEISDEIETELKEKLAHAPRSEPVYL